MPPKYKKYRIYLNANGAGYVMATSDTVNNLVELAKYWMARTSAGMSLPDDVRGTVQLHELDELTGGYKRAVGKSFKDKDDIITQVRKMGGR